MARKLEKLNRHAEQTIMNLEVARGQLRAICYGQDRYWRRYWKFPKSGGLYVEGIESAEPEFFEQLLQVNNSVKKSIQLSECEGFLYPIITRGIS